VEIHSDRSYRFPSPRDEVWEAIAAVQRYRHWWPWLRGFDGGGLEPGATWHCLVQPPLPYRVRFAVTIEEVDPPCLVTAAVTGDVVGRARLELTDGGRGSYARLVSALAPGNGALRAFAAVARPLVRRGHDWVLDTGARQFAARLDPTWDDL
jgi:hypothetical protein